jgi:hypothetical protein
VGCTLVSLLTFYAAATYIFVAITGQITVLKTDPMFIVISAIITVVSQMTKQGFYHYFPVENV